MIDSPGIELIAETASNWVAEGRLASRVERIISQLCDRTAELGFGLMPAKLCVQSAPEEHIGLGVGTQLSLAVARAVLRLAGLDDHPPEELARFTGRGSRSGIGLHGFQHGGLIVDGGRIHDSDIRPLVAHMRFPEEWSILIVQPDGVGGMHGVDETEAFAKLPPISRDDSDALFRLALLQVLPAVLKRDLDAFGCALGELQERVGAAFAPAQGGIYATPQAARIVHELKRLGFAGAGQSSWGPTLYAFSDLTRAEIDRQAEELCTRFALARSSVFCTKAANQGSVLSFEPAPRHPVTSFRDIDLGGDD
jgi:beta-RFAP synthase